jgi:hypothetical protein
MAHINGGSYIGIKTTLEVEKVPIQLIKWSQTTIDKKLDGG